ncbi:MAG: head maturation protease, ClpP-related [Hyphomicrobiales bacterium]
MSLRNLPEIKGLQRPQNYQWDAPSDVLGKWSEQPMAAEGDDPNTISIYDVIGEDYWSGGFTAGRMAAALRSVGDNPVTVNINSPGGDLFEGIAIYNLLREHRQAVTVKVMGWAASAASVIAMAGDEVSMGLGSFMMVHNSWGMIVGNRHDMSEGAELFASFDTAIADIYAARTGLERSEIEALMDDETFMGASEAVDKKFADKVDGSVEAKASAEPDKDQTGLMARRRIEAALAQANFPRKERSDMIAAVTNSSVAQRDASHTAARDAGIDVAAVLRLIQIIKS